MENGSKFDWFSRLFNNVGIKKLQNEDQNISDYGPWENLPKDIIEKIGLQLNSSDYMHSSMVCKSWRFLLLKCDILRPQMPWLLFPHNSRSPNIKFYNVVENKFHTFVLPKGVGGKVVGCSKGWVIFVTNVGKTMSLFNPISSVGYLLPPLPTDLSLQRVELSSSNVISDCIVVAIVDNGKRLAFSKHENERWEVVSLSSESRVQVYTLIDLVFCHQKLHVLINSNSNNVSGKIDTITLKLPNFDDEAIPITLIYDIKYKESGCLFEVPEWMSIHIGAQFFLRHTHTSYLVESIKGQVMLVQKHLKLFYIQQNERNYIIQNNEDNANGGLEEHQEHDGDNDSTLKQILSELVGFKLYKIEDLAREEVIIYTNLGEEQALFLSSKSRLCLPSAYNEIKGNCVHFIMEDVTLGNNDHQDSYHMAINGIYHLDDLTIEPLISKFQGYLNPSFMWFAPNLQHY